MKHYKVLRTIKTRDGQTIVKDGDILNPVHPTWDCFGLDKNNRFWTDDFLDKHPRIFQRFQR